MKKVHLFIVLISITIIALTLNSCKKRDTYNWAEISNGYAVYLAYNQQYILTYNSTVDTDSLIMNVSLDFNITYAQRTFIDEVNPLNSFNYDYDIKLKHSISDIILTSDYDFNNKVAGESLNDIVEVYDNPYFDGNKWKASNILSLQEYAYKYLVQMSNPYNPEKHIYIKFKEKPSQQFQRFKLDFVDSQGTHFVVKLNKIKWL